MSYKILIVADREHAEELSEMLKDSGHPDLKATDDSAAAPGLVKTFGPDTVLVDLDMDGIRPAGLVKDILEEKPVAIIVLASYGKIENVQEAEDMGASAYLFRPFNWESLLGVIEMGLSRFRQCQTLHTELGSCKEALRVRKLVERAKGIIMRRNSLNEEEAFLKLQKISRDNNMTMEKVAESIITASELI